jgi:NADPH:quinone reductase-like Zn-dependent oxidoreductase
VLGIEAVGIVEADRSGRFAPGAAVAAIVGGAEYIVVAEASVVPAPRGASTWEAATLLLNVATARLSLDALALLPGQTGTTLLYSTICANSPKLES